MAYVTLSIALKSHSGTLGSRYQNIGARTGLLSGRMFLAWDNVNGWKVRYLNIVLIVFRFLLAPFNFLSHTHLRRIVLQLKHENDDRLKARIGEIWMRHHAKREAPWLYPRSKTEKIPHSISQGYSVHFGQTGGDRYFFCYANASNHSSLTPREYLERIFGCTLNDLTELQEHYKRWSRTNHPDKVSFDQKEKASKLFSEVNCWKDKLQAELQREF